MKTLCIGLAGARYIDVVDICVPPALHHSFAIREADAGKHIIKENPLTGYLERMSRCPLLVEFLAFAPEENPLIKGTQA